MQSFKEYHVEGCCHYTENCDMCNQSVDYALTEYCKICKIKLCVMIADMILIVMRAKNGVFVAIACI